jgi:death-on-curing protein
MNAEFLSVATVLVIHEESLARFGGSAGVRDQALLESAVAQASVTFGGDYLHEDLFAMAAAYLFHIVKNHPFVDGNKRAGLGAALAFLDGNGVSIDQLPDCTRRRSPLLRAGSTSQAWQPCFAHCRTFPSDTEFLHLAGPVADR